MKRRRETPIVMSIVEVIVKTRPIELSLLPMEHTWACVTTGARFFFTRSKTYGHCSTKTILFSFEDSNGRPPADGLEFALAIYVVRLNDMADKDGHLPDEIERRDLSDLVDLCSGYLELRLERARDITRLETELAAAKRK